MTPLGYHAMRMRWCRVALWAFVRRWAAYWVAGAVLFAAGMSGGPGNSLMAVRSLCAWLVLPLFRAARDPVWLVPATLLQALVGAALVWGMRPLLWPQRWAAAERGLPIPRRDALLSDCRVVPLALLPWTVPCLVGAQALLASDPAWLQPLRWRAVLVLVAALVGSAALGVVLLQRLRQPWRASSGISIGRAVTRTSIDRIGWVRALVWWPLWRGPARRTGRLLVVATLLLCFPAFGLLNGPQAAGWWFAAYGIGVLLATTRLNGLTRLELQPLLNAALSLPLSPRTLNRGRAALALAPLPLSGALLLACLPRTGVRSAVLAAYVTAVVASSVAEVRAAPAEANAKASRWLFCMALMLALASEVMT